MKSPNNLVQRHKGNLTVSQASNPNLTTGEQLIEEIPVPGGETGVGSRMVLVVLPLRLPEDHRYTEQGAHAGFLASTPTELAALRAWRHEEQRATYK